MATLYNTRISDTYPALIKTTDNLAITATLKQLTDGTGNNTGLYINTGGDFKVSAILEWGSLKDTGTGVTITQWVTQANGISNFDNDTTVPTSAAVKDYVDTHVTAQDLDFLGDSNTGTPAVDLDSQSLSIIGTANEIVTSGNAQTLTIGLSNNVTITNDLTVGDDLTVTDVLTVNGTVASNIIQGGLQVNNSGGSHTFRIKDASGGNLFNTDPTNSRIAINKLTPTSTLDVNGTVTATTYIGDLNGTINTATTAVTQASGDSSTKVATTQFVMDLDAASDLDFSGDSGTGDVTLNSQTFNIAGTTNQVTTSASGEALTISLPSTVHRNLQGNVIGNLTGDVTGDLTGNVTASSVLANGVTASTQSSSDDSTKVATTAYVKSLNNASDLDFSGDSGTGAVILNTETLAITGTTNQIVTTASGTGISFSFSSGGIVIPNHSTATTQPTSDNSTRVATTEFVKSLDNASDLDFTADSGSGAVILNSQALNIVGTSNQITTTGTSQTITLSLPSSINVNSASATILETARNISLTGEATTTISSFNGSSDVSGAVTLDNNSVTGKVLTGLASPTASSVLASDSILTAFGKVQSQVNTLAGGLRFMGTWNATTNSPTLPQGGGEATSGTTTSTTANKLVDSSANFTSTVTVGDKIINQDSGATALVTNIDSTTSLTLDADIMVSGQEYTVDNSPFITQGHYYVVATGGTFALNGISEWAVGDWVIAGSTNVWEKLDHTQVDGTGTAGNITKWSSTNVIADSIMAESGSAITVTGSLDTTTALNSGGDFAVNTNKFTVASSSGNMVSAGTGTFTGNLGVGIAAGTYAVEVETSGNNGIKVNTGTSGAEELYLGNTGGEASIGTLTNHNLEIIQNSGTAISIDTSKNTTFTGKVFVNETGGESIVVANNGYYGSKTSGGTELRLLGINNGDSVYMGSIDAGADNVYIRSAGADAISIDSSQNVTVEGTIYASNDDPAYSFASDTTTGLSRTGGNQMAFKVGGNQILELAANLTSTFGGNVVLSSGTITASKNQNATSSFTFQNTDTTGTSVRTHLNATAGNRSIRLEAIHNDYSYVVSNNARMYLQTNSGSNNTLFLDGDNATFAGDVVVPSGLISILGGNNLTISGSAASHAGLTFATNSILPVVVSADTDNVVDLGQVGNVFKNLHLGSEIISGGGATFAGDVTIGGKTYPKLNLTDNQGVARNFSVGTNNETFTVRNETGSADVFTIAGADNATTFAGNIGVGGKTPAYGLSLAQGNAASNKIAWTDGTPNFAASIYANSSTDKLTFATKNASNVETIALEIDTNQGATFAGTGRFEDDLTIYNGSPEMYYLTSSSSHYNWMLAAQENVDGAFEITPSNAVGTGGVFDTPAFRLDASTRAATFAGNAVLNGGSLSINRSTTNSEAGIIDFDSGGFEFTADAAGTGYPITFNGGTSGSVAELMRIEQGGNVGIGTNNPTSPTSVTTFLEIEGTTAGIVLHDDGNEAWDLYASGGKLGTRYNNSVEGWWLDHNGLMGVGTTAPARKLCLYEDSSGQTQIQFQNSTTGVGSNDGFGVGLDSNEKGFLYNYEGNDIYIETGDALVYLKNSGGLVGVGTNNPTNKFSVVDSANLVCRYTGGSTFSLYQNNTDGTVIFSANHGDNGTENRFVFQTNGGTERMRLVEGNLGLGTNAIPTNGYIATGGGWKMLQIGQSSQIAAYGTDDEIAICQNTYLNTSGVFQAITSDVAGSSIILVDGIIRFRNATTSGTTQTTSERMQIGLAGNVQINSTGTGDQYAHEQTLTLKVTLGDNGVAIPIAFVDHTHSVDVQVVLRQDTANVATGKGHSVAAYGAATTAMSTVAHSSGNITNITLAYLNTNPSGQDYVLTLTPTFSAGTPPIAYVTIRGMSEDVIAKY